MKMYMVGGAVRDEILGVSSKDIDFTVVLDENDIDTTISGEPFKIMVDNLERMGFKVFLVTPEFLTVRAQFPQTKFNDSVEQYRSGMTADFVLARKEGEYTDGRRPDEVVPGTLEDDLARRDFTMNAIAKDTSGSYIDPFNGQADIAERIIRAVGDPYVRLAEDALRAVRAIRFAVTKGFLIDPTLARAMQYGTVLSAIETKISDERIQVELSKMFRYDTRKSLIALSNYPLLTDAMFSGSVSLDATMKTKGRGR